MESKRVYVSPQSKSVMRSVDENTEKKKAATGRKEHILAKGLMKKRDGDDDEGCKAFISSLLTLDTNLINNPFFLSFFHFPPVFYSLSPLFSFFRKE